MVSAVVFSVMLAVLGLQFLRARHSKDLVRVFCVLGLAISAGGIADGAERYFRLANSAALNEKYNHQSQDAQANLLQSLREVGTNEPALTVIRSTHESLRNSHETFWELINVVRRQARVQAIAFALTFILFGVTLARVHRESGAN
jgi:hypothetical protein